MMSKELDDTQPVDLRPFIRKVQAAKDPEDLWQAARSWFNDNGFPMVAYSHFIGSLRTDPKPAFRIEGYSQEFVDAYVGKRLYRVSPLPEIAIKGTDPIYWSDLDRINTLLEEEAEFLRRAAQSVEGDGLSIPVFGPRRRNGIFGLGHGSAMQPFQPDHLGALQLSAQLAHMAYCKMRLAEPETGPGISPREREILTWIARGKSNAVIADILAISRHTVDTHVRRLFEKLGVSDRTTAAVKGLGAGLLLDPTDL